VAGWFGQLPSRFGRSLDLQKDHLFCFKLLSPPCSRRATRTQTLAAHAMPLRDRAGFVVREIGLVVCQPRVTGRRNLAGPMRFAKKAGVKRCSSSADDI